MRRLDSLLMRCADKCAVPAGGALAVNTDDFFCYGDKKKSEIIR